MSKRGFDFRFASLVAVMVFVGTGMAQNIDEKNNNVTLAAIPARKRTPKMIAAGSTIHTLSITCFSSSSAHPNRKRRWLP